MRFIPFLNACTVLPYSAIEVPAPLPPKSRHVFKARRPLLVLHNTMPPKRTSSHRTFNTSLLEPRALVSSGGLQVALRSIKTVCNDDDSSVMEVIVELNSRPHVLEYILSSTSLMSVLSVNRLDKPFL